MTAVGFTTRKALAIPADAFNPNGIAPLVLTGARFAGAWTINACIGPDHSVIGSVATERTDDPEEATEAGLEWMGSECERAGLKIAHTVNHNSSYGPAERPYFTTSQVLVVDKDWV